MEVLRFVQKIGFQIFFICHEVNHLKIKFREINVLVASYLVELVTLEVRLTVDFSHRFKCKF